MDETGEEGSDLVGELDPDIQIVHKLPVSPTSTEVADSVNEAPITHFVQHVTDTGFVKTFKIIEPSSLQKRRNKIKMNVMQSQRVRLQALRKGQEVKNGNGCVLLSHCILLY